MRIRKATLEDADAVRSLTRAAYKKWIVHIGREPLPMTADYSAAIANHLIFLGENNQQLNGILEVIPKPDHLLIENIAVLPELQGKGFGSLLLLHAEKVANDLGLEELQLYTNAAFQSNQHFYASRGYESFRRERLPDGGVSIYMRKKLFQVGL
ncbi:MAG: GNAT family N-acetyltransferase [Stappiaceae bacterium]